MSDGLPERARDFYPLYRLEISLRSIQPPVRWVTEALSPGLKRPGREADHLHLVRNLISEITLHCPIRLHGVQWATSVYIF